jgi:hypothetical protein
MMKWSNVNRLFVVLNGIDDVLMVVAVENNELPKKRGSENDSETFNVEGDDEEESRSQEVRPSRRNNKRRKVIADSSDVEMGEREEVTVEKDEEEVAEEEVDEPKQEEQQSDIEDATSTPPRVAEAKKVLEDLEEVEDQVESEEEEEEEMPKATTKRGAATKKSSSSKRNAMRKNYHPIKEAGWPFGKPYELLLIFCWILKLIRVPYSTLCVVFDALEKESGRLIKIDILSEIFRSCIAMNPKDLINVIYLGVNEVISF